MNLSATNLVFAIMSSLSEDSLSLLAEESPEGTGERFPSRSFAPAGVEATQTRQCLAAEAEARSENWESETPVTTSVERLQQLSLGAGLGRGRPVAARVTAPLRRPPVYGATGVERLRTDWYRQSEEEVSVRPGGLWVKRENLPREEGGVTSYDE